MGRGEDWIPLTFKCSEFDKTAGRHSESKFQTEHTQNQDCTLKICYGLKPLLSDWLQLGFVFHSLHDSLKIHCVIHKGMTFILFACQKKRSRTILLFSHFSEDKDSEGKEKKSKSKDKDKDKDKKKEPASMFQINGEKDSKSKKKGDYNLINCHNLKLKGLSFPEQ